MIYSAFSTIGDPDAIARLAQKLKADYNYTFPMAANVSTQFCSISWLTLHQRDQLNVGQLLPMHSQPYRNNWIITVIQDMFFMGGKSSYIYCFIHLFSNYHGDDGVMRHEVPPPMVALVATAVSSLIDMRTVY